MLDFTDDFNLILSKYNAKLKATYKQNPNAVMAYLFYVQLNSEGLSGFDRLTLIQNIKEKFNIKAKSDLLIKSVLLDIIKSSNLTVLEKQLQEELVDYLKRNNILLNHISLYPPQEMGKVVRPRNTLSLHGGLKGNFVLASANEINELLYCVRAYNGGLQTICKDCYMVPVNANIYTDLKSLMLKEEVYSYYLKPDNFVPNTTIAFNGKYPVFVFQDEWIATSEQKTHRSSRINDITPILEKVRLLLPKSINLEENLALSSTLRNSKNIKLAIKEAIKKGVVEDASDIIEENKRLNSIFKI